MGRMSRTLGRRAFRPGIVKKSRETSIDPFVQDRDGGARDHSDEPEEFFQADKRVFLHPKKLVGRRVRTWTEWKFGRDVQGGLGEVAPHPSQGGHGEET